MGSKVIENLSKDLQNSFPDMKGLSVRNLKYMRKFAEVYPDFEIVQQVVAQIPWGHNVFLMDKISDSKERIWYANKILENGWSRSVLALQAESGLYNRQNNEHKVNNFPLTLPKPQSDLACELLKDPYNFDFLTISEQAKEKILIALNISTEDLFSNDELKNTDVLIDEIIERVHTLENDRINLEKVYKIIKFLTTK